MAQKTAVEWLVQVVQSCIAPDYIPKEIVEQALEMEKKQIKNAFNQGFSTPQWDKSKENKAEQYYNENFKSNKNETETN